SARRRSSARRPYRSKPRRSAGRSGRSCRCRPDRRRSRRRIAPRGLRPRHGARPRARPSSRAGHPVIRRNGRRRLAGLVALAVAWLAASPSSRSDTVEAVDTGLILAVDVSGSVTPERFLLQMDGIAAAFEDPSVQATILAGPRHALAIILVQWSDK